MCQPILAAGDKTTLSGTVTDALDGSPLPGVAVYLPELKIGAMTRDDGTYEIRNLPRKKTVVQVTYLGHQTIIETVDLAVVSVKDSGKRIGQTPPSPLRSFESPVMHQLSIMTFAPSVSCSSTTGRPLYVLPIL